MPEFSNKPLSGQMMRQPLLISSLLRHADRYFGDRVVVSYGEDGVRHSYSYRECHARARRLAQGLERLGVRMGERIATLAWNGYRHLELYYGISGMGAVIHTVNPRLHADQLVHVLNDAGSSYLFLDRSFAPQVRAIADRCPALKGCFLLGGDDALQGVVGLPNLASYESLLEDGCGDWSWPVFDENAAAGLCYTSGTTGHPKGVLYSHRSTVLHAYAQVAPDAFNLSARDTILPVVPMFHVNAWGLPYSAALVGASLVLPGPSLGGAALYTMCEREGVTFSAGVPTVWLALLRHLREHGLRFSSFRRMVIGGSACPPALMDSLRDDYGIEAIHAFGMTELSPLATVCTPQAQHAALGPEAMRAVQRKQGHVLYGIDVRIVGDDRAELPWDGATCGHLQARGHWVVDAYLGQAPGGAVQDGWFPTGDIANISPDGYVQITDRNKDLIKSGGEWIASIDLENIAMAHPAVQLAACVGVAHDKWDERPLLVVAVRPGATVDAVELLAMYEGKVARWWVPDDVVFVDSLPIGPTGKVLKHQVRARFHAHLRQQASE